MRVFFFSLLSFISLLFLDACSTAISENDIKVLTLFLIHIEA